MWSIENLFQQEYVILAVQADIHNHTAWQIEKMPGLLETWWLEYHFTDIPCLKLMEMNRVKITKNIQLNYEC